MKNFEKLLQPLTEVELVARINARNEIGEILDDCCNAKMHELRVLREVASTIEERERLDAENRAMCELYSTMCGELSAYASSISAKMDELKKQEEEKK